MSWIQANPCREDALPGLKQEGEQKEQLPSHYIGMSFHPVLSEFGLN